MSWILSAGLLGGSVGLIRFKSRLRAVAGVSLLILFLWVWMPFAWLTSASLERSYTAGAPPDMTDYGAIVVLSGSILTPNASRPVPLMGINTYIRCSYAAWLYRRNHLPVIASGGPISGPGGPPVVAAAVMRDFLLTQGVSPVWTEERSLSTAENAFQTVQILRARGISKIVLVTEAYHMPRAEACFRKLGIQVLPAPCSFNTKEPLGWRDLGPDRRAVNINENNFHEWVGLFWYRLKGII